MVKSEIRKAANLGEKIFFDRLLFRNSLQPLLVGSFPKRHDFIIVSGWCAILNSTSCNREYMLNYKLSTSIT